MCITPVCIFSDSSVGHSSHFKAVISIFSQGLQCESVARLSTIWSIHGLCDVRVHAVWGQFIVWRHLQSGRHIRSTSDRQQLCQDAVLFEHAWDGEGGSPLKCHIGSWDVRDGEKSRGNWYCKRKHRRLKESFRVCYCVLAATVIALSTWFSKSGSRAVHLFSRSSRVDCSHSECVLLVWGEPSHSVLLCVGCVHVGLQVDLQENLIKKDLPIRIGWKFPRQLNWIPAQSWTSQVPHSIRHCGQRGHCTSISR